MLYKITLDDDSYFIADEDYELTLYYMYFIKVKVKLKEYLNNDKYQKYHLVDLVNGSRINRSFRVEETDNPDKLEIGVRYKNAKDIVPGDMLVGPDGKPRTVEECHTGEEDMYEIQIGDKTYQVNGNHVLNTINKSMNVELEITVRDYMQLDPEYRDQLLLVQVKEG